MRGIMDWKKKASFRRRASATGIIRGVTHSVNFCPTPYAEGVRKKVSADKKERRIMNERAPSLQVWKQSDAASARETHRVPSAFTVRQSLVAVMTHKS